MPNLFPNTRVSVRLGTKCCPLREQDPVKI